MRCWYAINRVRIHIMVMVVNKIMIISSASEIITLYETLLESQKDLKGRKGKLFEAFGNLDSLLGNARAPGDAARI